MPKASPERPKPSGFALRLNIWLLKFSRNWLRIALVAIGIYVSLPFVTPILMRAGVTGPARVLYTLYSPFCHQFAFRSLFLFGEQVAYPRAVSTADEGAFEPYVVGDPAFLSSYDYYYRMYNRGEAPGSVTLEDLTTGFTPWFQFASRDFPGNDQMGYKMTLCARDISIYAAIFIGGLAYSHPKVRRRLRPVPLWLYVFLGLGPIALDGLSQLLGYPPFNLWPPRETLPEFRVLTGAIFGLMNVWLGFPYLDESMQETRLQLEAKLARAGIHV
jgi:uncharacterized membrane protein